MTQKELMTLIKEHLDEISESHDLDLYDAIEYFINELDYFLITHNFK